MGFPFLLTHQQIWQLATKFRLLHQERGKPQAQGRNECHQEQDDDVGNQERNRRPEDRDDVEFRHR